MRIIQQGLQNVGNELETKKFNSSSSGSNCSFLESIPLRVNVRRRAECKTPVDSSSSSSLFFLSLTLLTPEPHKQNASPRHHKLFRRRIFCNYGRRSAVSHFQWPSRVLINFRSRAHREKQRNAKS